MMSMRRVFIDWSTPALPSTAEYLCTRYTSDSVLDLQRTIVVFPGARAGRRLLEILVDQAEARQLVLVPPRLVTVGQLPELLYEAQRPVANALTQQLAWVAALRHARTRVLAHLTSHLPADHDLFAWCAFGELLAALHHELAGECLTFADVARRGETLAAFRESARWQALAAIQAHYLQVLETHGVWDQPTARLWTIDHGACRTGCDIILVGNEKTIAKTFAGIVQTGLYGVAKADPEAVLYDHGRPDWQPKHTCPTATDIPEMPASGSREPEVLTIPLRAPLARRTRGLERVRPWQAVEGSGVRLADRMRPGASQAMARGALLHAC